MRPPAWVLRRTAVREVTVGGTTLPAGSTVLASQFVTHHDPRLFPDPDRFDPGRFAPEGLSGGPPGGHAYAWFPFGGGPRGCLGAEFATMEATLAMATLVRRWRVRMTSDPEPAYARSITLRPRRPLRMRVEERSPGESGP